MDLGLFPLTQPECTQHLIDAIQATNEWVPEKQANRSPPGKNYKFSTEPNPTHGWTQPTSISGWDPADWLTDWPWRSCNRTSVHVSRADKSARRWLWTAWYRRRTPTSSATRRSWRARATCRCDWRSFRRRWSHRTCTNRIVLSSCRHDPHVPTHARATEVRQLVCVGYNYNATSIRRTLDCLSNIINAALT